jgi:UMP-CMP kinase
MSKPNVVFVLGGPGAGKGTQCEKIVQVLLIFIISNKNFFLNVIFICKKNPTTFNLVLKSEAH